MANINTAQSGNFTDPATWVGGVVPTVGDTAFVLNGHVVTINSSVTCDAVVSANTSGYFDLVNGAVLNANVTGGATEANNGVVRFAAAAPATATINGNIQVTQATSDVRCVRHTGTGILTVNGDVLATTVSTGSSRSIDSTNGTLTINGNVTGPTSSGSGTPIYVSGSGNGPVTINGNIVGGAATSGWSAVAHASTSRFLTVKGGVTANGSAAITDGFSAAFKARINGTVTATATAAAISGPTATVIVDGDMVYGSTGRYPIVAAFLFLGAPSGTTVTFRRVDSFDPTTNSVTASSNIDFNSTTAGSDYPAPANVRLGTTYGLGDFTGTLAVPPRSLVSFGVATDNTTGTAALNLTDITNAITSATSTVTSAVSTSTSNVTTAVNAARDVVTGAVSASTSTTTSNIQDATDILTDAVNTGVSTTVAAHGAQIAAATGS